MKIDFQYHALNTDNPNRPLVKTWGGFTVEATEEALKTLYSQCLDTISEIEKLKRTKEKPNP